MRNKPILVELIVLQTSYLCRIEDLNNKILQAYINFKKLRLQQSDLESFHQSRLNKLKEV